MNYYRLMGHALSFREECSEGFRKGTTLEQISRLYDFDRKLRHLLEAVLEAIEITFRTRMAYVLAHRMGPLGYRDSSRFREVQFHKQFMLTLEQAVAKSKEVFVPHHQQKYGGEFPIWVAVELLSFGDVSKLYKNMVKKDQDTIGNFYKVYEPFLSNWVRSCVTIRNVCAHHARLYGRITATPKLRRRHLEAGLKPQSLFVAIFSCRELCPTVDEWRTFVTNLEALVEEYEWVIDPDKMGFPNSWVGWLRGGSPVA